MDIVLASQSPRRKELLTQMGLSYRVHAVDIDEHMDRKLAPGSLVETISREKAAACAALEGPEPLIIAADTVVAKGSTILGKPRDEQDAREMLRLLSGVRHDVYTGYTIRRGDQIYTDRKVTFVSFRTLTDEEIDAYIATGEPMDKAGAYGIQGFGALLVAAIKGDYFNVMGLPVCALGLHLREFGVNCITGAGK